MSNAIQRPLPSSLVPTGEVKALPAKVKDNFLSLVRRAMPRLDMGAVEKDWIKGEPICIVLNGMHKPGRWHKIQFTRILSNGEPGPLEERIAPTVVVEEVRRCVERYGSSVFMIMYKGRREGGDGANGYHNFGIEPLDGEGLPADRALEVSGEVESKPEAKA